MNITHKKNNTANCLTLKGDLTIYEAQSALNELKKIELKDDKPIHLDLSEVTELDTAGLQLLFYLKKRHQNFQTVKISKSNPQVNDVLTLLKLHTLFETEKATP